MDLNDALSTGNVAPPQILTSPTIIVTAAEAPAMTHTTAVKTAAVIATDPSCPNVEAPSASPPTKDILTATHFQRTSTARTVACFTTATVAMVTGDGASIPSPTRN
ncbi:uncharacterized protein DS421_20g696810 [Arachis hypogaea]|nr:uncharacterized protein DS421_20g696810 [Arachis hypogaea]